LQSYARELSAANHWPVPRAGSAVVWREPMAFGGRRLLVGDGNAFQDMISSYYGLTSAMSSCQVANVAADNRDIKLQVRRSVCRFDALQGRIETE